MSDARGSRAGRPEARSSGDELVAERRSAAGRRDRLVRAATRIEGVARRGEATTPRSGASVATIALGLFVVGLGALLRLDQYLSDRSLWLDESLLALNVIDRPIAELAEPLDLSQGAPLGFLVSTKLIVLAFGKSEAVFRLLPLLSGMAVLAFYFLLARRVSSVRASLLGVALLACSSSFIYYSAEFKQYSTEVAVALLLSVVAVTLGRLTLRRYVLVSLLGTVLLWFAFTTIFFLAAFACAYGVGFLLERRWRDLLGAFVVSLPWLLSALALYRVTYVDLGSLELPVKQASTGDSGSDTIVNLHGAATNVWIAAVGVAGGSAVGRVVASATLILAIVGGIALLRARPYVCLMLGLPVVAMVGAILMGRYPTFERTVLIAVPALVLIAVHGAMIICRRLGAVAGPLVGVALAGLLLAYPLKGALEGLGGPRRNDYAIRPLMEHMVERWRPGDGLYVHYAAQYAFRYYLECECLGAPVSRPPLVYATARTTGPTIRHPVLLSRRPELEIGERHGVDDIAAYRRELDRLRDRDRIWYLSSHWESSEERDVIRTLVPHHLDGFGRRESSTQLGLAQLLLYDLDR